MRAKVVDVYDGDTVQVVFGLNGSLHRWRIRLDGIDTPEMKGKGITAEEKILATAARDRVRELILDKIIEVELGAFEKYGRLLATLYTVDGRNVNNLLMAEGHAKAYGGGTKEMWV